MSATFKEPMTVRHPDSRVDHNFGAGDEVPDWAETIVSSAHFNIEVDSALPELGIEFDEAGNPTFETPAGQYQNVAVPDADGEDTGRRGRRRATESTPTE